MLPISKKVSTWPLCSFSWLAQSPTSCKYRTPAKLARLGQPEHFFAVGGVYCWAFALLPALWGTVPSFRRMRSICRSSACQRSGRMRARWVCRSIRFRHRRRRGESMGGRISSIFIDGDTESRVGLHVSRVYEQVCECVASVHIFTQRDQLARYSSFYSEKWALGRL
jgi:hypothetical protein